MLSIGDKLPACEFKSTDPKLTSFEDLLGKNIVIYFYPKDNTPGCTQESKDFRDLIDEFTQANTQIIGISRDSINSHTKFCEKHALSFPLISDPDEKLCQIFDVIIQKQWFKRLILGIDRSTFLIDSKGIVRQVWRNVRVKNHAAAVLQAIRETS